MARQQRYPTDEIGGAGTPPACRPRFPKRGHPQSTRALSDWRPSRRRRSVLDPCRLRPILESRDLMTIFSRARGSSVLRARWRASIGSSFHSLGFAGTGPYQMAPDRLDREVSAEFLSATVWWGRQDNTGGLDKRRCKDRLIHVAGVERTGATYRALDLFKYSGPLVHDPLLHRSLRGLRSSIGVPGCLRQGNAWQQQHDRDRVQYSLDSLGNK